MQREPLVKSLRHAAKRIRAWSDAFCAIAPEHAPAIRCSMCREALRLEADALLIEADGVNDDTDESTKRAG